MNKYGPYSISDLFSDLQVFFVRVADIDKLPVQLTMATEEVMCRTLVSKRCTGLIANLSAEDVFNTVIRKMTYGERSEFSLRDSYGHTGKITIYRSHSTAGDGSDGLGADYDDGFAEMFQLDR